MVRRWSCVNKCNLLLKPFKLYLKVHKKELFKASVNYKRFAIKFSKFKRKALSRWKHRSNWVLYTSLFKTWSRDYLFNKQMFRSHFLTQVLTKVFYIYDLNALKTSRFKLFNDQVITSTITRAIQHYSAKTNNIIASTAPDNRQNANYSQLYNITTLKAYSILEFYSPSIILLYAEYGLISTSTSEYKTPLPGFDATQLFPLLALVQEPFYTELYKILSLLVFLRINVN